MSHIILGIDPGTFHLGFGFLEKKGNQFTLIKSDIISPPKSHALYDRLSFIAKKFEVLLGEYRPKEVAIENLFHGKNIKSAFHLGLARGIIISECLRRDIKIFEYAPTQVKSVVTGYGRADKTQVKKMVELTLGVSIPHGYDATDALAIALCHGNTKRFEISQ
jgi:crossover junction endodeoxyribonuclease RuvC